MVHSHASGSCQGGHFKRAEFDALLQKKAMEEVTSMHPKRGFFSRIFLVQKRSGGWRRVTDLSCLNQYVLFFPFQNGDFELNQTGFSEGRLGYITGSEGCIFLYQYPSFISSLSSICFRRENVQVSNSSPWSQCKPIRFHLDLIGPYESHTAQGIWVCAYLDNWLQPYVSDALSWLHSRWLL